MEKENNTGLGLIKTTIERVQNEKSLFGSALKKLVNSTEEELDFFLKKRAENQIKSITHCISEGQTLILKALEGKRLIANSEDTFKCHIDNKFDGIFDNFSLNKQGSATPATVIRVDEINKNGTLREIFRSLPGNWNQKKLTQDQVIEFCISLPKWLKQGPGTTFFLVPSDGTIPIDEKRPEANSTVLDIRMRIGGLSVYVYRLDDLISPNTSHRVVYPRLETRAYRKRWIP